MTVKTEIYAGCYCDQVLIGNLTNQQNNTSLVLATMLLLMMSQCSYWMARQGRIEESQENREYIKGKYLLSF